MASDKPQDPFLVESTTDLNSAPNSSPEPGSDHFSDHSARPLRHPSIVFPDDHHDHHPQSEGEAEAEEPEPESSGQTTAQAQPGTATPPSAVRPGSASSATRPRPHRKVQWSIAEDAGEHDFENSNRRKSTSEPQDYFTGQHGSPDGMVTPEGGNTTVNSSSMNTPEHSRPPSPGDHDVDILPGEVDGLPDGSSIKRFQRQAAKLIAVHRAKNAFKNAGASQQQHRAAAAAAATGAGTSASAHPHGVDPNALQDALARTTSLEEGTRPSNGLEETQAYTGTVGVLGSLLQLYSEQQQQQQREEKSAMSSSATLVNPPELDSAELSREPSPRALTFAIRRAAEGVTDAVRRPIQRMSEDRHPHSAMGALYGSSINLAGVAAPNASTVRPNPDNRHYRVSRFSLGPPDRPGSSASAPASRSGSPTRASHDLSPQTSRQSSPPVTPRGTNYLSPTGDYFSRHKKPTLNLSFSNLADTFNPAKLHSESHVLRHYKSGSNMAAAEQDSTATATPAAGGGGKSYEKHLSEKTEWEKEAKFMKQEAKHMRQEAKSRSAPTTPKGALGMRKKPKKPKANQQELFITMHVAQILARQDFILRLARALMMFGGPSHQFETQLQRTAKVLDINCQVIYLMSFMIIAFQDPDTHTSELKIIKQGSGLNIHKLKCLAILHWEVMHDKISVTDASTEISRLMTAKPTWNIPWSILLGGLCSTGIGIAAFRCSFVDMLVVFVMGCTMVAIQTLVASKSDVLTNCFELFTAALFSFIAAGLSSTGYFCYAAVISSSIVLMLPGWLILPAAMELQSRSIVVGSVRLVWALIYSLFLGFGISLGTTVWNAIAPERLTVVLNDSSCASAHSLSDGSPTPWWLITIPDWFYFIGVPLFAMSLAMKNQAKVRSKEFWASTVLAGTGWTINHFASDADAFKNRSDISSALAAFAVGIAANVWGKWFQSTAFVVAVTPIMLMLPSGLSNSGFLNYAVAQDSDSTLNSGFNVATQLLSVTIGLVVGLFGAACFVYPFSSKRAKGLMAF